MNEKYELFIQKFVDNNNCTCKPIFVLDIVKESFGNEEMDESEPLTTDQENNPLCHHFRKNTILVNSLELFFYYNHQWQEKPRWNTLKTPNNPIQDRRSRGEIP